MELKELQQEQRLQGTVSRWGWDALLSYRRSGLVGKKPTNQKKKSELFTVGNGDFFLGGGGRVLLFQDPKHSMASIMFMPFFTFSKTTCFPFSHLVLVVQMKTGNHLPWTKCQDLYVLVLSIHPQIFLRRWTSHTRYPNTDPINSMPNQQKVVQTAMPKFPR